MRFRRAHQALGSLMRLSKRFMRSTVASMRFGGRRTQRSPAWMADGAHGPVL